ncbi:Ubiquitin conjugation factor E4 A-like 1 [Homarus americanus]|uniref:Ubiquitin conjugation factor E4 A-like 1 n=1 Tax=Homarus americanus TaxID=6706 RepID=A0A8J5JJ52_HOMAM|nr:Ubiquitin conjugation factor E4 A-like 1 [Homarus americanus]
MGDAATPPNVIYQTAISRITKSTLCVDHLLETIHAAERALSLIFHCEENEFQYSLAKAVLGIAAANNMAEHFLGTQGVVTGRWETLMWTIVDLVKFYRPEFENFVAAMQSRPIKLWLVSVFKSPEMCPSFRLRLQMLYFLWMWNAGDFQDKTLGEPAAAGLVSVTAHLELDQFLPSLICPIFKVLRFIHTHGYLDLVAVAAIQQVGELRVGTEVRCLVRLVEVASMKMKYIAEWHKSGSFEASLTVLVYDNIFLLLKVLVTMFPTSAAFKCPGLAQAAALSLVTATSAILSTASNLQEEGAKYKQLFNDIDDLFQTLANHEKLHPVLATLRADHGQYFSIIRKQVADSGYRLYYLPKPCEERTKSCPERFLDSVTQAVMEAPVLLHSSKMVVDESTLIHLLLTSPSDPFTRCPLDPDTYSRLPDLQDDIVAWRNDTIDGAESDDNDDYWSVMSEDLSEYFDATDNDGDLWSENDGEGDSESDINGEQDSEWDGENGGEQDSENDGEQDSENGGEHYSENDGENGGEQDIENENDNSENNTRNGSERQINCVLCLASETPTSSNTC